VRSANFISVSPEDHRAAGEFSEGGVSGRGGGACDCADGGDAEVSEGRGCLLAFADHDDRATVEAVDPVQGKASQRLTSEALCSVGLLPPHLLSVSVVDTAVDRDKVARGIAYLVPSGTESRGDGSEGHGVTSSPRLLPTGSSITRRTVV
jgi:hypothetical protein